MRQTQNYNLPQFEGNDFFNKEDFNNAFEKIDTGLSDLQETINIRINDESNIVKEVQDARKGKRVLKEKIDEIENKISSSDSKIESKADKTYVDLSLDKKANYNNMNIHVIDLKINNGLCVICEIDDKVLMYDFGSISSKDEIVNYCTENNITKIDYAILSHWHSDHYGGIEGLISSTLDFSNCSWILPPELDYGKITEDTVQILQDKSRIEALLTYTNAIEDKKIEINEKCSIEFFNCVYPESYFTETSETGWVTGVKKNTLNNFGVVCLLNYNGTKSLLLADIEYIAQENIYEKLSQVDLMLAPHHFYNKKYSENFYKTLSPKICISSTNVGSSGLPLCPEYYALVDCGANIYVTRAMNQHCKFELKSGEFKAIKCQTVTYSKAKARKILGSTIDSIMNKRYDKQTITFNDIFNAMSVGNLFVGNLNDCSAIVSELKSINGSFYSEGSEQVFILNKVSSTKMTIDIRTENQNSFITGYNNGSATFLQQSALNLRMSTNISFDDAFNLLSIGQKGVFAITVDTLIPTSASTNDTIKYAGATITKISSTVAIIDIVGYSTLFEYKGYYNTNGSPKILFKKVF